MKQVKGIFKKKEGPKIPTGEDFIESAFEVQKLVEKLKSTEENVVRTIDSKIEETETVIKEAKTVVREGVKKIDDKVEEFEKTAVNLIKEIKNIPTIKGDKGQDADEDRIVDKIGNRVSEAEKMVQEAKTSVTEGIESMGRKADDFEKIVLSHIREIRSIPPPTFDEENMLKRMVAKIPYDKQTLDTLRKSVATDPMSVIDKIMEMPHEKFKLKTSHVDGLDQTIRAFQSQLGRGYLHGGGISNITGLIQAGTNISITGSGTSTSPYIISSTGDASVTLADVSVNSTDTAKATYTQLAAVPITFTGNLGNNLMTMTADSVGILMGQLGTIAGNTSSNSGPLFVGKTDNSTNSTALRISAEYNGTSGATAFQINGFNAFAVTAATSTDSSSTTGTGGALRNRMIAIHAGSGTLAMVSAMSARVQNNNGNVGISPITNSAAFHVENPSVNTGTTWGTHSGLWIRGGSVNGTITTKYGVRVDDMVSGTTRYAYYSAGSTDLIDFAGATTLRSGLTVIGTTTLDTGLTGILKATAGVVSVGTPGTDYATTLASVSTLSTDNTKSLYSMTSNVDVVFRASDGSTSVMTIEEVGRMVGIGNSAAAKAPTSYLEINPGVAIAGDSVTKNLLNVTGTFATSPSAQQRTVVISTTGAGSASFSQTAMFVNMAGGYTGSSPTLGISLANASQATGTGGFTGTSGNFGGSYAASGATVGHNIGANFSGSNSSTLNLGGRFGAISGAGSASLNVGLASFALNAAAGSAVNVGGFFGLMSTAPTLGSSAALIADNGAVAADIFVARDNGTVVFTIADGGAVTYTTLSGGNITDSALTAGRVTFAGTGGLLTDDADLTFSGSTLTATNIVASTAVAIGTTSFTGANTKLDIVNTGASMGSNLRFINDYNTAFYVGIEGGTAGDVILANIANTDMWFSTNNVERVRITKTGITNLFKGADVASASAIVPTGNLFHVTGTTSITSITATNIRAGTEITLIMDATCQITEGNNLIMAGNFSGTVTDTITFKYDGTNWYEMARSNN